MTLIEVIIVVALIGLFAGAIALGTGALSSSRRRAAATFLVSSARLAQAKATSTGRPVRLVLDLDTHRVMMEQALGNQVLREKPTDDEKKKKPDEGTEEMTPEERAARQEAERILDGPTAPRPTFEPVEEFGADGEDRRQGRSLGEGVRFRQVQTEHDEVPRTEGKAYLHFWPGGLTEEAAIQIFAGEDDTEGLTVRISALTGRARIERGRIELPPPREDGKFSDREEP